MLEKIGQVAYKLLLLSGSKIHPTFHVSQLKKHVGNISVSSQLPMVGEDGTLAKEPVRIIERRMVNRGNKDVTEVLVQLTNSFPEDATWEVLFELHKRFPTIDP